MGVIVEYLNEALVPKGSANVSLLPPDAARRAKIRLFVDIFEGALGRCESSILGASDQTSLTEAAENLTAGFKVVDAALDMYGSRQEGPFLQGEHFCLAEVLCAPQLQRLAVLLPHFRPTLPCGSPLALAATKFPRLAKWTEALLARPSVVSTFNFDATVAVKRRMVADLRQSEDYIESAPSRRRDAAAALEVMLKNRLETRS